jgi:hypothetical protein
MNEDKYSIFSKNLTFLFLNNYKSDWRCEHKKSVYQIGVDNCFPVSILLISVDSNYYAIISSNWFSSL